MSRGKGVGREKMIPPATTTRQVRVWCHSCQQHKTAQVQTEETQAGEVVVESVNQDFLVCPSCGSDFVEEVEDQTTAHEGQPSAAQSSPGQGQVVTDANGQAGYLVVHGPITLRVETRGQFPQLLQSIFTQGGVPGGPHGNVPGNLGDFVFHNEALERVLNQLAENHVVPTVPASQEEIAKLPRIRSKEELDCCTSENCSICQDGYEGDFTAIKMPCGHIFHEECLLQWFKVQNSCPICRLKLAPATFEEQRAEPPTSSVQLQNEESGVAAAAAAATTTTTNEEMIREMNDIDEDPPRPLAGSSDASSERSEVSFQSSESRGGNNVHRDFGGDIEVTGTPKTGSIYQKLAPLVNIFKWVAKPLGKVLRFGMSITDKLMRK